MLEFKVTTETVPAAASQVYRSRSQANLLPSVTSAHPSPAPCTVRLSSSTPAQVSALVGLKSVSRCRACWGERGEVTETCKTGNGLPPQSRSSGKQSHTTPYPADLVALRP